MSKITFSPKQEEALSLAKENILVSAGAGSGKTAVLVERIIRILTTQNVPLERILVLTFTRAGAQEFKNRIKKSLLEHKEHAHKAFAVDNADITTFDAYALKIVQKYAYMHKYMQSNLTNLDENLETVLIKAYFDEIMEGYYRNPTPELRNFAKRFLNKDDKKLFELIKSLDRQVKLEIYADDYIENYIDNFYSDTRFESYYKDLDEFIVTTIRNIGSAIKKLSCPRHLKAYETFLEHYGSVLSYKDYMDNRDKLAKQRRPNGSLKEFPEDLPYAEAIRIYYEDLKETETYVSKENMYSAFLENKEHAAFVIEIYRQVRNKLLLFKKEKQAFTFSDIARGAYELVNIPAIGNELKAQYDYILIDEYQDTSDIQEEFINKIANNNVYMVGDIKQSIYAFRNANCDIFREKYARYRKLDGGRKIDLNDNYRSRPEVLTPINAILSEIMTDAYGGANYKKEHVINQGNLDYDKFKVEGATVGIDVINYIVPKEDDSNPDEVIREKVEYEVDYIISDIRAKMAQGYRVYDKNEGLRKVRYSDFTILMAEGTKFDRIEERLINAGIPVFVNRDEDVNEDHINIAINKLLILFVAYTKEDEPRGFEFRLAAASFLRGFVNNYSDQALFDLFRDNNWDFSKDPVLARIKQLANSINHLPVMEIVHILIEEFDIYGALYYIRDLTENTMKLSSKLEEIENLATLGLDLEAIVNYFKERENAGAKEELKRVKLVSDAVTIMTIHGSKGLEFPIVYYMDLENNFYKNTRKQSMRVCPEYGFILPNPAYETQKSFMGFLSNIYTSKETLSEKIRLLYVALTRAKELMVIIHPAKEGGEDFKTFEKSNSLKDLLLQSSYYEKLRKTVEIDVVAPKAKDEFAEKTRNEKEFSVCSHSYEFKSVSKTYRVSELIEADEKLLARGTLLHRYFEEYDFTAKNLDYIKNQRDREHVANLLKLPFFANTKPENIYREYEFIDENTGKTYTIDCFIKDEEKITLLDLKLSNIYIESYDLQVRNYASYLQKVFKLPVRGYLVSITTLEVREVKLDG